jgi:hypothetical protein
MPIKNRESHNAYRREWYAKNREARKEYLRRWVKEHPESRRRTTVKTGLKWRAENREKWMKIVRFLGMDQCSVCGYKKCFRAIDFHHRNPKDKETIANRMFHYAVSISRVMEFDKCVAVCSNCHREIHDSEVRA